MLINEIVLSHEYYRHELLNNFVNFFKRENLFWGVRFYFKNKTHITPEEMEEVFTHFQTPIRQYISDIMPEGHYEPAFRTLCKLKESGLNWKWVNRDLETDKPTFIKMMLQLIKDENYEDAKETVDDATASGLDWPEIPIIQRSIDTLATKRSIAEGIKDNLTPEQRDLLVQIVTNSIDKSNIIIGLYNINQWGVTVKNLPELEDILNKYKPELVTGMLKSIKQGVEGAYSVEQTLSRLEGTGIKWPELAIIRKSLNYDNNVEMLTPIDESYNQTKIAAHHLVGMFKDAEELQAMSPTHFWLQVEVDLMNASHTSTVYDISAELDPHKKDILRWILTRIKEAADSDVDLDDKVPIDDMVLVITGLRRLGVKWPELDQIQRSIEHEAKQQLAEDPEQQPLLRMHRDSPEEIEKRILPRMFRHMAKVDGSAVLLARRSWNELGIGDPEVAEKLEPYKSHILQYLNKLSDVKRLYRSGLELMLMNIYSLQKFLDWPELDKMIDAKKKRLIRLMLKSIMNSKGQQVGPVYYYLNKARPNWPELRIIGKSLEAEEAKKLNGGTDAR